MSSSDIKISGLSTTKAVVCEFDVVPQKIFQRQSNGTWVYTFGFEETERQMFEPMFENTIKQTMYLGFVILLNGETSLDNFKRQVMDYFWGVDRENQYINEYNIAINNLASAGRSEVYIANYKRFLEERVFVLDKLESDFKNSNIM